MADPIRYIDPKEFREVGFLQEANRLFFHPLGLALEVRVDDDGTESFSGVWDYRDDPEGMIFGESPDLNKVKAVDDERQRHVPARLRLMGTLFQPVGWDPTPHLPGLTAHGPPVGENPHTE